MAEAGYNNHKLEFMLDYIITARRSGRNSDIGQRANSEREELVMSAEELYNKVLERCRIEDPEEGRSPINNDNDLIAAHYGGPKKP